MRNFLIFSIILTFFCIASVKASADSVPIVKKGVIYLSDNSFKNGYLLLNGDWEFYWDTLIGPGQFNGLSDKTKIKYIKVPASWSSKKAGSFPVKGFATYRVKILSDSLEGTFGLKLFDLFTASKVWFDGRLIYSTGQIGTSKKKSKPGFSYNDIPIFFDKSIVEHELVVQVSNFNHTRSGIVKPVKFGHFNSLANQSKSNLILNLLIIGIILFIGLNHLMNYFLYKNEITNLFFGLLCLVMIIRNISSGQRVITYIFPTINWELLFKLDNFSGFGTIPIFAIFLYILYRKDFPRIILNIFVSIGILITLFVAFTPQQIYGRYRMFFELYILVGGLFLTFYILLRAALKNREGALLTFIGFFILYATAINDVLISMGLISSAEVAPFGLVVYMLIQSFVLSKGSALALEENKKLGLAIRHEKEMLEERVVERTRELEERNAEIIKKQDELKNQAWLNESLASVNILLNKYNKSDIKTLSQHLLNKIIDLTGAQVGVIYIVDETNEKNILRLSGAKNAGSEIISKEIIELGEGLVGACFKDMKLKKIENISESYIKLNSGLGETILKNIILVPLVTNEIPVGVIELASYKPFTDIFILLLEKISESISSTIQFIRLNTKNIALLEEFRIKQNLYESNERDLLQQQQEMQALREEIESIRSKK